MANLAAADLLVTVVVMPLDAAWNVTVQWYGGEAACRGLMFLKLAAMYASAFVTVVIAVDRHAAIVNPLAVARAERRNKAMLGAAWALSAVLALPQVGEKSAGEASAGRRRRRRKGGRALTAPRAPSQAFVFRTVRRRQPRRFVQCATVGSFGAHWQETLYNMFTFTFLFLLPLLVMLLCYGRILAAISGRTGDARVASREIQLRRSYDNIPRARMRTLKMSIVIVLTFIVCWTPYYLLGLWYWFSPEMLTRETVPPSLSHILFLFGLFNTCLDPLVYGLFTVHFRREMWRVCRRRREEAAARAGSRRVSTAAGRTGSSLGGSPKQEPEVTAGRSCEPCRGRPAESSM
ncbi:unnamed protein product [Bubo scandiacus]